MDVKVGETVTRMLAGTITMELKVSEVTDERIICGPWEFCASTGAEIDDDLGWGPPPLATGSDLQPSWYANHELQ